MFYLSILLNFCHCDFTSSINSLSCFYTARTVELKDNSVRADQEIALAEISLETNDLWDENNQRRRT